jgi:spore coat polysaccharide biosynthesis protein SpsF
MARAAIVLQARMGSRRLPGKVLAMIAGRTVLEHCVERLRATSGIPVVVATTTQAEDDCVARESERLGVDLMRGPAEDVLGRFVLVTRALSLDDVVRATADNPAVDMDSPRRVLDLRRRAGVDHVVEDGLPYGSTVEAISAAALFQAAALTTDPDDREHVTRFIRRDPRFIALRAIAPAPVRHPALRLTIDTADDLAFVRSIYEIAEVTCPRPVPLASLIDVAGRLTRHAARS